MEAFLRRYLPCLVKLWDWFWPPPVNLYNQNIGVPDGRRVEISILHSPPAQPNPMYTALYDFQARTEDEMSIKQGETLEVIDTLGDFVRAKKLYGSTESGLVPANYVTLIIDEFAKNPWYFGAINRKDAESLLMSSANAYGAFLVRISESNADEYSLSARNHTKVNHYRISRTDNGDYCISNQKTFKSLEDLIAFHKIQWQALGVELLRPCAQQRQYLPDSWEKPHEEFVLKKKLGEGQFGEVWEGLWKKEKKNVAIKMLKQEHIGNDEFGKEIQALKNLHHPKLIKLYAICAGKEPIYIVTELMSKGSLLSFLHSEEGKALATPKLMYMAAQVAEGMAYLEDRKIVHRDLAARNILVGDELICKVADFGLARIIKDDIYLVSGTTKIPMKWTAPEAILFQKYSIKSDIWSFGILMYEIVTYGEMPYEGKNNKEVVEMLNLGYRMPCPVNCSSEVYTIMSNCWKENPDDRPSFHHLQSHLHAFISRMHK
ncbi:tyrosine-protein kinase Srms [Erpetoichthys calabaricus]|uniref:tyrosine-protein kinase Srms n=1 Tax=Erpetoichthys calabaricus TaxID=27687 RepID=UPI0022349967|nr:tyrosine-protein kinase Srms [Erpetoichthys calabaricus]